MPRILGALLLVGLVAAVYAPTLGHGFVSDDRLYVTQAEELRTLSGLGDIWLRLRTTPQYYPVAHTLLWLEYQLWGLDARGYHAVNLALHALVALLLWRLLLQLAVPGAWLAAAVFAVHPVHVETVAWVSEIKNLASAAFGLAAILVYLRFAPLVEPRPGAPPPGRRRDHLASLTLYLCAVMSKTVVATIPAVLLVLAWWKRGRVTGRDVAPLLPFAAGGLALSGITVWMERVHVGAIGPEWELGPIARLLIAGRAVWFYAGKIVWPDPLHFTYPRWRIDPADLGQLAFPALALALLAVLWALRGCIGRGPLAAALLFGGILTPALGFFDVFPFLFSFVADHYQYHASMALIAALAAAATMALERSRLRSPWARALLVAALLTPLGVISHGHTGLFESDEALILGNARGNPDSWAAWYRLGVLRRAQGDPAAALPHFREALRLFPERARLHNDVGDALLQLSRPVEAKAAYEQALAGTLDEEDRLWAHLQLATLLVQAGRGPEAWPHCEVLLDGGRAAAELLHNCAVARIQSADLAGGIALLEQALASGPERANSRHALGHALVEAGRPEEALPHLERALALEPEATGHREELARALLATGALDRAETLLRAQLAAQPEARTHNLLGVVLARRGDLDAAIAEFQAALALDATHEASRANLDRALGAREGGAD